MAAPSRCGQHALQVLGEDATSSALAPHSASPLHSHSNLSKAGLAVWKVNRSGKVQSRRIAVTPTHIVVSSSRIKSVKGLWSSLQRSATNSSGNFKNSNGNDADASLDSSNSKRIPFVAVDRIQSGLNTKRFLQAEALRILSQQQNNGTSSSQQNQRKDENEIIDEVLLQSGPNLHNTRAISIIYKPEASSDLESLDFIVPTEAEAAVLLETLQFCSVQQKRRLEHYTPLYQMIHYYWQVELQKDVNSTLPTLASSSSSASNTNTTASNTKISFSEWMTLVDKLSIPLPKSTLMTMFRDMCMAKACFDEKLVIDHVVALVEELLETAVPSQSLTQMWNTLVQTDPIPALGMLASKEDGAHDPEDSSALDESTAHDDDDQSLELHVNAQDETISAVAFLSFLRSHQKEYQTTLEQAMALLHTIQRQWPTATTRTRTSPSEQPEKVGDTKDRLSKAQFMAYLTSDANELMLKSASKNVPTEPVDDMSQPLSHYWISSSHDTYLQETEDSLNGKSAFAKQKIPELVDSQAYAAALLRGVRCLELDVWDGLLGEPVVARNEPEKIGDGRSTPLPVVLRTVAYFVHQHPDTFPIILKLENHCKSSTKLAEQIQVYLGHLLWKSSTTRDILPSPADARGKVILIGKRPSSKPKSKPDHFVVVNDDFDDMNNEYEPITADAAKSLQESAGSFHPAEPDQVITGFGVKGPIWSSRDTTCTPVPSPEALWNQAVEEAQEVQKQLEEARQRQEDLTHQADEQETLAATLTLQAGLTASDVKRRAAIAAGRRPKDDDDADSDEGRVMHRNENEEEKSMKDEGIEIHEVLPELMQDCKDQYAFAAQESLQATRRLTKCEQKLQEAEKAYQKALQSLDTAKKTERDLSVEAKRAASDARAQFEHAAAAKERVETVQELLRNSQDRSSSAGTVVQTAMTEAKISEKRATDAEARAARARGVAERDRHRADEETKMEESMEQEVSDFHEECIKAMEAAKEAKQRVEKATGLLERVKDQVRQLETSTKYRQEQIDLRVGAATSQYNKKVEERDRCHELIKEAKEEAASADSNRSALQAKFEEKAHAWRIQAEVAAQSRRTADRSASLAEELTEHAEEEREAAELRHVAKKRAESAVEERGSHTQSIAAQLAEAERASAEASKIAVASRQRAERLSRDAEIAKDHEADEELVETTKWEVQQAKGEYEAARLLKRQKDEIKVKEKRRLDTDKDIVRNAHRGAGGSVIQIEPLYEQEAIVAFNTALLLRKEVKNAKKKVATLEQRSETKNLIAKRARDYREFSSMSIELPPSLADGTAFHTTRFKHWNISKEVPSSHMHSFSQKVVLKMLEDDAKEERQKMMNFTLKHLCRVFPSWTEMSRKATSNYDPVLAWSMGCQLVSMNYHSADENLLVADGLFRKNGSCGYTLKPPTLLGVKRGIIHEQVWSFKVLCAFRLPRVGKRAVNPFVTVSLYGGSETAARTIYKTNAIEGNGLSPVWDETKSIKLTIENPAVSMVAFAVWSKGDKGNEFIGGYALPASSLREGYRSVPLFKCDHSRSGPYLFSSLLVNATKK